MSKLYIRLPARSVAESAAHWLELDCLFALVSQDGSIEREGVLSLSDLIGMATNGHSVALLLAASDVTLLRVQIPPLSAARLKAALPNLVEDLLIVDPSDCVIVAGALFAGLRTVAVVQRDWLDLLNNTFIASGVRRIAALPMQLCLHYDESAHGVTAAINPQGTDIEVVLRLSEQDGIGLLIAPGEEREAHEAVLQTLRTVAKDAPISLYVSQAELRVYQEAINPHLNPLPLAGEGAIDRWPHINVLADTWQHWIADASDLRLDLLKGAAGSPGVDWRAWRWPLALAAAVLVINAAALNMDWWRMKSEINSLRATMIQTYRSAYPKETVIIDPVAQMRQKIAIAKRGSGQAAPDDFTVIVASLGEVLTSVKQMPAIAVLEYRERSLFVRFKPVLSRVEGPALSNPSTSSGQATISGAEGIDTIMPQLKSALAERNLSFELMPGQSAEAAWRIRSVQ